jgi:ATP-binding cassette subfamily C protein CydC
VTLGLQAGRPTVLTGASGIGKTSLLKQIAGWTGNDALASGDRSISAAERQAMSCFCPHDAAILADTVRANLFAPNASDAELCAALMAVEMDRRVEGAGGLDAWITQDTLSLGEAQRLNLARAWLTDRPIVLLDEPTEHLDVRQAARIVIRLLDHLADRVVVLSSHAAAPVPRAVTVQM